MENEFLQGVWRKVRCLEYEKNEAAKARQRQVILRKDALKSALYVFLLPVLISSLLLFFTDFSQFSLIVAGVLFLGAGAYNEYRIDVKISRRQWNEYYNK